MSKAIARAAVKTANGGVRKSTARKIERGDRVMMKDGRSGVVVIVHEGAAIVHCAEEQKGARHLVFPLGELVRG